METLKDYMGDDISSISNFSSERLLSTIFDVADVLDMSIEEERNKRVELLYYIKKDIISQFAYLPVVRAHFCHLCTKAKRNIYKMFTSSRKKRAHRRPCVLYIRLCFTAPAA